MGADGGAARGGPVLRAGGRAILAPSLVALLVALVVAALASLPGFRLVEARLFDLASTAWHPLPPEPGAIIVAIDEPSFAELGLQWPWPRALHAQLVDRLRAAGARVIGLDILFAEPSADTHGDAALAAAMRPDVVLAADEARIDTAQGYGVARIDPMPALTGAGARSGLVTLPLDGDGAIRRMPQSTDAYARALLRAAGETAPAPDGALIQYLGPPRTYPTVSYYQALDPGTFLPADTFRDRIVVVGFSLQTAPTVEEGGADAFATPETAATGELTAGAEIHATILDNLSHTLWIAPVPPWAVTAGLLLAALAGVVLVRRRHPIVSALAVALAVLLLLAAALLLLRHGRLWWPPLSPALALAGAAAIESAREFARELQARRAIERAFAQYLAPEMVARLARDPAALKLGGERRVLTLLFCDVRGFTTLTETLKDDPERLTRLLGRLLDPLSEAVLANGGTIDKYIGDCIMAFWNAPLPDPAHAAHAVAAARDMLAALDRLNAELAAEGEAPLRIGIGINTGECVVGNMGSRHRFDYTALGDAVNLASRLEGLSKTYGVAVVIGAATVAEVPDVAFRELDRIVVRGRASETPVFTLPEPAPRQG